MSKEEAIKAVTEDWKNLANISEYRDDKDVVIAAMQINPRAYFLAGDKINKDMDLKRFCYFNIVKDDWTLVKDMTEFQNDKIFMKDVVQLCGMAIMYASDDLKKDDELIDIAIRDGLGPLMCLGDGSVNLPLNSIMRLLRKDGTNIRYVKNFGLPIQPRMVLEAMMTYPEAWQFANLSMWDDKYFVNMLVKQDGTKLENASKRLKNDKGIVLAAIRNNVMAIKYADIVDEEIVKETLARVDLTNIDTLSKYLGSGYKIRKQELLEEKKKLETLVSGKITKV